MKTCKKCKIEKPLDQFTSDKSKIDGLRSQCKSCDSQYRRDSKNRIKCYNNRYYIEHKEERLEYHKEYCKNNKEQLNDQQNEYKRERRKNNLNFKLAQTLRTRASKVFECSSMRPGSFVRDLGCTIEFLKIRLESMFYPHPKTGEMMAWDNYGRYGWHIDHIIPLASFDLTDRDQFLKACHYTNLQPLWAEDNLRKGDRII